MRILIVVDPERFDFYSYLSKNSLNEYCLIWHEKESDMKISAQELPLKFKNIFYWTQFGTPLQLLNVVKPDKIIFFEIIDLRQIALLVTANFKNITTFYLEHGAAGDKEAARKLWWDKDLYKANKWPYFKKRIRNLKAILQSKVFYYSVLQGFNSFRSFWKYFWLPFQMLRMLPNKALGNNIFEERVPKFALTFNQVNFDQFQIYTGCKQERLVTTGIPFFDRYFSSDPLEENYIIYIEHPYLEQGFLNWTKEHHKKIAEALFQFAKETQTHLYIKLHPASDRNNWKNYEFDERYVAIIQQGDYTDLFLKSKMILGYSSSLITGLACAKKNIVLLGWHPEPHIFGLDFSRAGVCHKSLDIADLTMKVEQWKENNLCENETNYITFLKKYNWPFDGKATERVFKAINEL
jgi:CDP-glycerol glycerophosphotransferase (TagB/SpsB family)